MDLPEHQKVLDALDNSGYVFTGYGLILEGNPDGSYTPIPTYKAMSPFGDTFEAMPWFILQHNTERFLSHMEYYDF
jgi:hypothetical protein